jgi:trans-2,3-dihydro-3-hydroxyanthranilate isomerase
MDGLAGDGILPQRLNAGNPTLFVPLRSHAQVDRAWQSPVGMKLLRGEEPEPFCMFAFAPCPTGAYSRMFAPAYGIPEDPVTGSATGPLAAFMMRYGLLSGTRLVSEQGTPDGPGPLLHVEIQGSGDIGVGGHVTAVGAGAIQLQKND